MLNNKVVLITGGTGSFGKKFIETILLRYSKVKKIIIYSRDELKQSDLKQKYTVQNRCSYCVEQCFLFPHSPV